MAKQPSNGPLIVAVGMGLLLLLGANIMAQKNNPEIAQKLEQEKEAKAQEEASKKQATPAPSAVSGGSELAALGDRATFGDKGATVKVVLGYSWTPDVQGNPGLVYDTVKQLQTMAAGASVEIVNVDAHPEVRPGISANGKLVVPAGPDGSIRIGGSSAHGLMEMMRPH